MNPAHRLSTRGPFFNGQPKSPCGGSKDSGKLDETLVKAKSLHG